MYNIAYTIRTPEQVEALRRPDFITGQVQKRYSNFDTFRDSLPKIGLNSLSGYGAGKPRLKKVNLEARVEGLNNFMNDLLQKSSDTSTAMNKILARKLLREFLDFGKVFMEVGPSRASSSGAGGTARRASKKHSLEEKKTFIMNRDYSALTITDLKQLIECLNQTELIGISTTSQSKDKTLLQNFWDKQGVGKVIESDWAALKEDYINILMYIDKVAGRSKIDHASEKFGTCKPKVTTRSV